MKTMDFDQLNTSIDNIIKKLNQVQQDNNYLRQRESNLIAENRQLAQQIQHAQTKIEEIIERLKSYGAPS